MTKNSFVLRNSVSYAGIKPSALAFWLAFVIPTLFAGAAAAEDAVPSAASGDPTRSDRADVQKRLPSGDRTVQSEADIERPAGSNSGVISKSTIGNEALRRSDTQTTYDAIKNVPGVTQSDAKSGGVADALQIRGIRLNSQTSYRLDGGMALETDLFTPTEDKERVEVLKGASALQYGLASPAGIINYTMKRAGDKPNFSFSTANSQFGQTIGTLDFGRRYGDGGQLGIRTIISGGYLSSYVKGVNGTRGLLGIAGDWQPTQRLSIKMDFEQFGVSVTEQATLLQNKAINNVIALPRIPSPYQQLAGPYSVEQGIGQVALLSGTYLLDYGFKIVGEAGRSESRVLDRRKSQIGAYNIVTGDGTLSTTRLANQDYVNTYLKGELKNHFEYSFLTNDLTLGINRNGRDFNNPGTNLFTTTQNLYAPYQPVGAPSPIYNGYFPTNTSDLGYYFQEDIGLFQRVHLLGGLRALTYTSDSLSMAGVSNHTVSHVLSPGAGVSVDIFPALTAYASYLQALEETGSAPQNAINQFQILPPAAATQKEVGIRSSFGGFNGSVAYFVIDRGNATTDPNTLVYALNGTIDYRGIEASGNYVVTKEFDIFAGGLLLNAHQHSVDKTIDGLRPENAPKVSGNIGFNYNPAWFRGLSFNAGALFTGSREINPQNQGTIPAVTIVNLGMRYKTAVNQHPVSFNINCENIADVRYFSSAVNNALGVGRPRTITFGTRMEF